MKYTICGMVVVVTLMLLIWGPADPMAVENWVIDIPIIIGPFTPLACFVTLVVWRLFRRKPCCSQEH